MGIEDYTSNRVFDGVRVLSAAELDVVRKNYRQAIAEAKAVAKRRDYKLHPVIERMRDSLMTALPENTQRSPS